jgi:hypothetical protein
MGERLDATAERLDAVRIIPEPYHSRLESRLEAATIAMTERGLRYGLTIADMTASVAYANQAALRTPAVLAAMKASLWVATILPVAAYAAWFAGALRRWRHAG